jgi:hypothetical protein
VQDAAKHEDEEAEGTLYHSESPSQPANGSDPTPADAATALARERLVEDYVASPRAPSVAAPMSERAAAETIEVLRIACETDKAPFIVIALGALERLVARGFLQGEARSTASPMMDVPVAT